MSGPLIASFSGKTVMLQVPDIIKKTSQKASAKSEDPWRLLFETTIESVVAASGHRLRPIDPSLLESLSEERLLASPILSTAGPTSAASSTQPIDDPLSEPAVRAVIRQLQKDSEFLQYFTSCLNA